MNKSIQVLKLLASCAILAGCTALQPAPDLALLQQQADAAYAAGNQDEAGNLYAKLVAAMPEDAENWFRMGNAYSRTGREEAAIDSYRRALQANPKHARAWYNLGVIQMRQAQIAFEQIRQLRPASDPLREMAARMTARLEAPGIEQRPSVAAAPANDGDQPKNATLPSQPDMAQPAVKPAAPKRKQ